MKAAFLNSFGPPEVIQYGDLPTPSPMRGEVRVKVAVAAVNPVDTYIRAGMLKMDAPMPFIPGCDFAGTVDSVGAGVTGFKIGDRVWGSNQGLLGRQGTFAECVCVSEDYAYPTPENVSDEDAAANALVGITAWIGLVAKADVQPGEIVLINGATGGVGSMALQIAHACGAYTIAVIGRKAEAALSLGAHWLIDYNTPDLVGQVAQCVKSGPEVFDSHTGVDVFYDTQPPGDLERTVACMNMNGRIIVMAGRAANPLFPNGAFYPKNLSLFGFAMFNISPDVQRRAATDMNRWMSERKLKSLIGARFPLEKAAEAHRLQEENTIGRKGTLTGKIIVTV